MTSKDKYFVSSLTMTGSFVSNVTPWNVTL